MPASTPSDDLPDDPVALRALFVAERAKHEAEIAGLEAQITERSREIARLEEQVTERDAEVERLNAMLHAFRRHRFDKRSEKLDADQQALALDDLETAKADQE